MFLSSVPKKTKKKNPNTYSVPKRKNQIKNPIVVVAVAKLARRRRQLTVARRSSQREQITVSPLIADRSTQLAASASPLVVAVGVSGAQLATSPLVVAVGISGAHCRS